MTIRTILTLITLTALTGLVACSTTNDAETTAQAEGVETRQQPQTEAASLPKHAEREQMMNEMCPMKVEGTTRSITKLDGAVGMDFTTTGDVAELRQRVTRMAGKHAKRHAEGGMMKGQQKGHGHMHGDRHGDGMQQDHKERRMSQMTEEQREMRAQMMQMMADTTVETEEIDGGMRMKFTPANAEDADQIHKMMHRHAEMAGEDGQCPMMHMMGSDPSNEAEQ